LASIVLFRKRHATPPGPPGFLFLGNIFDLPKKEPWKVYLQWGKQYNSDIFSMKVPGMQFVIMNSAKVIQDLLIKRSGIYLDRPHSTMLDDLSNSNSSFKNITVSSNENLILLRAAVDAILSITYGIIPTNFEHPFIKAPEEFLPRWFPGVKFHEVADKRRALPVDLLMGPYKEIKSQVENGTAVSSVVLRFLYAVQDGAGISESEIEVMCNVLGNTYLGGADMDDVCDGYVTPKGSIMIPNEWAVLQDESIFGADTDKFIPERFIKPDGKINPDLLDVELAFGFGRHACPGKCGYGTRYSLDYGNIHVDCL
ncbi:cytochrome P450, partial [Tricholoma matsutake]